MEDIRRHHNDEKRSLIQSVVHEGLSVLDVGAGFGGDLKKWSSCGANVSMCDPSEEALQEAKTRAKNLKIRVTGFYLGDIAACPNRKYDVVCYNFSLHYIFASEALFHRSIREIRQRLKPGGKLMGIIPDSERIQWRTPYQDEMGNWMKMKGHPKGVFGEKLFCFLTDTPFYADAPKSEPVAWKDVLVTTLEKMGFTMVLWSPLEGHPISQMYSKFLFVYK